MKKKQKDLEYSLKTKEVYIDSNLFITSATSLEKKGEKAREIINKIKKGELKGYTSALTIDEVMWIVQKIKDRETAYETSKTIMNISNLIFIPTETEIISKSIELYKNNFLRSRDAIHLATMLSKNINTIISSDPDFDRIKGIKRIDFTK